VSPRRWSLRALRAVLTAVVLLLAVVAAANAASDLYIRGGGDGHGIGMSQYGAYGYALHGAGYQAILTHYYQGTALGSTNPQQTVRVLLASGRVASFTGASAAGRTALQPATTYDVTALAGGGLAVRTTTGRIVGTFTGTLTVSGSGPLSVPGQGRYDGTLQISATGRATVQTVNAVGLDDYVRGVVPAEMPASWAPAALEAQAVAARTYAITTTVDGKGYDLYDDTRSQMYGGVGVETAATDAAVAATSGQVVTYGGKPVVTYFFASSGGYTESIQDAWPGTTAEPWLVGVPDPYDAAGGDPYHTWSVQMSLTAAAAKLRGLVRGSLIGIAATHEGSSPRVVAAEIVGTRGRTRVTGAQLQDDLGLDSTLAAFTAISTQDPSGRLTGTVYPAPSGGAVAVQADTAGAWRTVGRATVSAGGAFATTEPAGRYRVVDGSIDGPAVTIP